MRTRMGSIELLCTLMCLLIRTFCSATIEEVKTNILKVGDCTSRANQGYILTVNFVASFENGTVFESSYDSGPPFEFVIGDAAIQDSWNDELTGACLGAIRHIAVPSSVLSTEKSPKTPPDFDVVFHISIIQIMVPTTTTKQQTTQVITTEGVLTQLLHTTANLKTKQSLAVKTPTTSLPSTIASTTKALIMPALTTVAPTTKSPITLPPTTKAPKTLPPTTKAPTTLPPTTKAPTTLPPTTKTLTTKAPTTKSPTTLAPTTKAPTTLLPTTIVPTTLTPEIVVPPIIVHTTLAPTTIAPTTLEQTTLEPTTTAPTTIAPTTQAPTTSAPTSLAPPIVPSTITITTPSLTTEAPSTLLLLIMTSTTHPSTTSSPTTNQPTTSQQNTTQGLTTNQMILPEILRTTQKDISPHSSNQLLTTPFSVTSQVQQNNTIINQPAMGTSARLKLLTSLLTSSVTNASANINENTNKYTKTPTSSAQVSSTSELTQKPGPLAILDIRSTPGVRKSPGPISPGRRITTRAVDDSTADTLSSPPTGEGGLTQQSETKNTANSEFVTDIYLEEITSTDEPNDEDVGDVDSTKESGEKENDPRVRKKHKRKIYYHMQYIAIPIAICLFIVVSYCLYTVEFPDRKVKFYRVRDHDPILDGPL